MTELITTGVDRLVQLIMQKKRISIDDAAKELSVPKVLIEEWADFLEEREVIGIDYQFAKPFLVYKEMSKQETNELSKQFEGRKEGFVRKVDSVLQYLDQESEGLNHLRQEFGAMTTEMESKLGHVREDLQMLTKYEDLKKEVDTRIGAEEQKFEARRQKISRQIDANKASIARYLRFIEKTENELSKEEQMAKRIMENEAVLEKKMLAQACKLAEKIESDRGKVAGVMKNVAELGALSQRLEIGLKDKKISVAPLIEESKQYEAAVAEIKEKFLSKITSAHKNLQANLSMQEINKIKVNFTKVFSKKEDAQKLLDKLNGDLIELKKEFHQLANEALVIKASTKSQKVTEYVADFEQKYNALEEKKETFRKEVTGLSNMFKNL
jgi:chromosome segregation ATPase